MHWCFNSRDRELSSFCFLRTLLLLVASTGTMSAADRIHPRIIIADNTEYKTEINYINGTGQEIYNQIQETNEVTLNNIIYNFYEKFVSLAFDYADSRIFFNNGATKKIHGISLEGDNQDPWVIYNGTSAAVEGITVDWLTNNTYWTDAVYKWIKVANIDGYTRSLTTTDLDHPSGITCNPMTGYLYWSDIGRMNKIERSTLAGEERTVLLDENSFGFIGRPRALTIDHQDNILYWLDNSDSYIVSFDLNDESAYPRDLKQVVTSGDLFSFDIDPEFGFFVTDMQDNDLHIVPLDLRKTTRTIFWQHEVPHGIIFYSDKNQPKESAPCESAGCDQLCASDPAGYRCFCTYGYQLNNDEKTCEPDGSIIYGHEMIFSMEDRGLCSFQPNIAHHPTPEYRCFSAYVAGDLDLDVYALYVFTVQKMGDVTDIWRLRLEATEPWYYTHLIELPSSDVRGIAVDWIASNLYIIDAERREILISSLDGSYVTTLVDSDISRPTAIAVHAPKQYLFWTDIGPNPRIERSDLSGRRDRRVLVYTRIESPTHLAIDMQNDRIYWADGETLLIESMQLDGQNREVFYNYTSLTNNPQSHFTGLAIFKDLLYITESGKTLRVFDKTRNDLIQSITFPGEIKTMKFFHESLQPLAQGPCAVLNEECDEICINTNYGAECVCSTSSCTPVYRCPLTIENGKLLAGCDNRNGYSCDYMCNIGYLRATDEPVTCMEPGEWSIKELCRLPPRCTLKIPNGLFSDQCDNKIGESCNYTCIDGYRRTTMDSVTCVDAGEWSIPSEDLCVILHCFSGPCQNDGKCTDTDNGFNCTCSLQWHGDVCDERMSGTTGGYNGVVIAVTLVVIVLVITAIVVLVLFRRKILRKSGDSETPFDDVCVGNTSDNAYSGAPTAPPASAPAAPTAPPASASAAPIQSGGQTNFELKVRSIERPQQLNVVADDPNVKGVFSADHNNPNMAAATNDHTYDVLATPIEMFPNGIENKGMDETDGDGTSDYTMMKSQVAHDDYMTLALMSDASTNENKPLGQSLATETTPPGINDTSRCIGVDDSSPEYFAAI